MVWTVSLFALFHVGYLWWPSGKAEMAWACSVDWEIKDAYSILFGKPHG
jgi:hypothetical protein